MKKIALFLIAILPLLVQSQTLASYKNVVSNGYNFWVYTPKDYDSLRCEKPLLLFLHGASLCGNDLNRVRKYGPLAAIAMGRDIDAVIVAPQADRSWQPDRVENVMEYALEHYAVDTNRIYVYGMSMGGYGTINYVGTYPKRVAAAMAMCGGGNLKEYCNLTDVPLWILHGTADRAVGIGASLQVYNAIKKCKDSTLVRFTKLPGQSHSALAKLFYIDETYDWLFSHRLDDSPRQVNQEVKISVASMAPAYQNIDRTKNKITVINGATGQVDTVATKTVTQPVTTYHTVKKGDTLYGLALKYHTTVAKICKLNNIKETAILSIGRRLRIR